MRIVVATGGSGGHIFPALKVAEELKKDQHDVFLIGSFGKNLEKIQQSGFTFKNLNARGVKFKNILSGLGSIVSMITAFFVSIGVLKKYKPEIVFGFGGYGAFPVVLAAIIMRYPTMIHEQNVIPGRANIILSKFVKRIAISFQASQKYFNMKRVVLTGCPCPTVAPVLDKKSILKEFKLAEGKKTIFIFGGSQGSHRINLEFLASAVELKANLDFQVIHACGKDDFGMLKEKYEKLGVPFALYEFLDKMNYAYTICDLVVSRAGAATITELAYFKKPSILIPYPFAGGHQKENARVLEDVGMARVIEEKDLSPQTLSKNIVDILRHSLPEHEMKRKLEGAYFPDAIKRLAQEVVRLKL